MIVAGIVNTVAGKEVESPFPVLVPQLGAFAAREGHIHLKYFEKPNPLGINEFRVEPIGSGECLHLRLKTDLTFRELLTYPTGLPNFSKMLWGDARLSKIARGEIKQGSFLTEELFLGVYMI
jgi:hypothetical protein